MRTFIKIMLLPISLWAACKSKSAEVKDFIPGTYVNQAQSAYSVANDTLEIKAEGQIENNYRVIRRTGFSRIKDGKFQVRQHKTKSFTAIWDAQNRSLQLTQNGTVLLFKPDSDQLVIENSIYHKIREGL